MRDQQAIDDGGTLLRCQDCDSDFVWSIGEQQFYEARGLQQPKRCARCRQSRRQRNEQYRSIMTGIIIAFALAMTSF